MGGMGEAAKNGGGSCNMQIRYLHIATQVAIYRVPNR